MTTRIKLSLLFLFIFQVLISVTFELAHDEAYYWLYSRHLDWGFFDHPPFVGVIIGMFSFLGHSEFAVRFGFILMQFIVALFLLKMTPSKNRIWALLLYFSFPIVSVGGMLALPDMPLVFMTVLYVYLLREYLLKDTWQISTLLGLAIAALFYAKYHGVLLVFFTILAIPKLLLRKSFYLVALTAIVAFAPHLWWQHSHEYATLRYHFIERPSSDFSLKRTLEFILLQVVLAGVLAGPVVWWSILREKSKLDFNRAMKFIAVGTVVFFVISSLSKKTEANWTIFLCVPLIILTVQSELWDRKWCRSLLVASFVICMGARLVLSFEPTGKSRMTEFHGWKKWSELVEKKCEGLPIMANSYQIAAKLSFYLNREVPSLNYHSRKNQFDYWKFENSFSGDQVCYVTDKSQFKGEEIDTPDLKKQKIVKNQLVSSLLERKTKEIR